MLQEVVLSHLLLVVEALLEEIPYLPGNPAPEKKGGYLTVMRESDGLVVAGVYLGEVDPGKLEKYRDFSGEKARRLRENPFDVSSWQSRDPENNKWGGAIRIKKADCILSFSGLPELLDEALMMAAATSFAFGEKSLETKEGSVIIRASKNKFVPDVIPLLTKVTLKTLG